MSHTVEIYCRPEPFRAVFGGKQEKNKLVLSVFPGVDLLGKGFEAVGYCVVRGPDLITGGDIRDFRPVGNVFEGVIGGPPCQDFSRARRGVPTGYGLEMLEEMKRVIRSAWPVWWLLENVPTVPDLSVEGYSWQRIDLSAAECGGTQQRLRHFQFGTRDGTWLIRPGSLPENVTDLAALASEGERGKRRGWPEFCRVQGLEEPLELPGFTVAAKYRAVGNGVPVYMARRIAFAVLDRRALKGSERLCDCGCGRFCSGRARMAGASCRQRMKRRRDRSTAGVPGPGTERGKP